jgi:hypothetical protein
VRQADDWEETPEGIIFWEKVKQATAENEAQIEAYRQKLHWELSNGCVAVLSYDIAASHWVNCAKITSDLIRAAVESREAIMRGDTTKGTSA